MIPFRRYVQELSRLFDCSRRRVLYKLVFFFLQHDAWSLTRHSIRLVGLSPPASIPLPAVAKNAFRTKRKRQRLKLPVDVRTYKHFAWRERFITWQCFTHHLRWSMCYWIDGTQTFTIQEIYLWGRRPAARTQKDWSVSCSRFSICGAFAQKLLNDNDFTI